MQNSLDIARNILLNPAEINDQALQRILDQLMGSQIDYADLYFQAIQSETWVLEDGIVKDGSFNVARGVGIRANCGEKSGFAYSDEIVLPALTQAATAARSIAVQGQHGQLKAWQGTQPAYPPLYIADNPLQSMTVADKLGLLRLVDAEARRLDHRVKQVIANLAASYEVILIVTSEGELKADVRPLIRMNVQVIVEDKGRTEAGYAGGGGRTHYGFFVSDEERALGYAREAVRIALVNLNAVPAPVGMMPVVLGPGWPGVLLHEAVGHGLEGDFNRKGTSIFSNRIGQQVASSLCTVVDDGTLPDRRGSLSIDDEGTPTNCTVLIEKGILKGYMQDKLNARLMKTESTGNGRRESYAHLPMPRMTNTYMLPGPHDPAEIIASVKQGIYAVNFDGGQVDITSGKFIFSTSEAYLIQDGKITHPVKNATLIGNGPDVLTKVSMLGNDLKLDSGIGVCGKDGQSVPVGVGQPTLKVDMLTVGGTQS